MSSNFNPGEDGTQERERQYHIVKEWISMAQPFEIVKAIAEAEGFDGSDTELYNLKSKKSDSVANDLEHAIECLVDVINSKYDEEEDE